MILSVSQLLSAVNCWIKCIILDPSNETDHPECKSRPDSGLSAITELDPGYITGILHFVLTSSPLQLCDLVMTLGFGVSRCMIED